MGKTQITVEITVNVPISKAWECWTNPQDIVKWNFASDDWCCPKATNDLRVGGKFSARMEAKDGSFGFDFAGTYDEVKTNEKLAYSFGDRKATVTFTAEGTGTKITETFDAETQNPIEMQKNGWQSILNNFKKHAESK